MEVRLIRDSRDHNGHEKEEEVVWSGTIEDFLVRFPEFPKTFNDEKFVGNDDEREWEFLFQVAVSTDGSNSVWVDYTWGDLHTLATNLRA